MHFPKEKGRTMIYKTLHSKLKIVQHELQKNDELTSSGTLNSSCSTSESHRATVNSQIG